MKKILLSLGVCAAMATTALAGPTMVASYKLGDAMGAEGVTLKTINFYDSENKVIRTVNIATDYAGASYTETITYYVYDENGLLTQDYSHQYRPAYGDWVEGDVNVYQYDDQGRLIQLDDANRGYKYTYDENGYLTNEKYYSNSTPTTIQDINYFDFDANGNPARSESDGYQSDYRFDGTYTYDAQGRCIDINRLCTTGAVHSRSTYEYDAAGVLTLNYEYMSAYGKGGRESAVPGSAKDTLRYDQRIERNALGNGWYNKVVWTWTYYISQWTKGGSTFNELYVNIDGAYAPRNIVAENISTTEQPQTARITCDVPVTLPCENASYLVWRSGELVGTATAVDGKIEFIDSGMPTGTYEYIVQTYDAAQDVYYNTTDVATVDITVPLAPASNIRVVGGYWGKYSDAQTPEHDSFFVKLAWDVNQTEYTILGYKVWLYPWAYALYEIEGDVRTVDVPMTDATAGNFRIDVIYEHGVKEGEYVPLFWDNSADFEGEPIQKLYLTNEVKYGDHMGGTGASNVNYYIYDNQNNLSRRIDYGYQTDGNKVPTYHYFYDYNEKGQLISEYYRQMNAMGEWGKNKMTYVYTYDDLGRLTAKEDTTSHRLYEYFYDEQGHLVTMTDKGRTWGQEEYDKLYSTTTYSNFDENGNPLNAEYVHAQYASSSYNTVYTYDAQGRVLVQESRTPEGLAYEKIEFTYDVYGIETSRTVSKPYYDETTYKPTERFVYSTRTVREAQGDSKYKKYDENYDLKGESWSTNGRYSIETYSPLNGALSPKNLIAADVSSAESPNTIEVECNFPDIRLANAQYIIWRGWTAVDTVTATAAQGIIRFKDVNVENGTYEYFVQTYDAATDQSFNATAPVKVTLETTLAPVTNLHYTHTSEGVYRDIDVGELPAYWIHFAWDAPDTYLNVLGYNVYQDGYKVPMSTTTNTNDSVWVYREDDFNSETQAKTTSVSIGVIYELGESEGVVEVFTVEPAAVGAVEAVQSAYVAGKYLVVAADARVAIYNVAGAAVANYNNQQRIDLTALPTGVYVAVVEVGGTKQVVKIAR